MLGAIIGDTAGSIYEFNPWQGDWRDIPLFTQKSAFTDDTVLTIAVAHAFMASKDERLLKENIVKAFHWYVRHYPHAGYGGRFAQWINNREREPYNSWGNGSAMRVSPVGWMFPTLGEVEKYAAISASVTHNHPEGIKGATAVAGSIFLARSGKTKNEIKEYLSGRYEYNMNRDLAQIRETYKFDESCQGSVPEAIIAFFESNDFEEAIRKAIWLRGDADTQAAIAGSIAEAFYQTIPGEMASQTLARLDKGLLIQLDKWRDWLGMSKIFDYT